MAYLQTDHTLMTLLRRAARKARMADVGTERPLTGRNRALRDVLSQVRWYLATVDIDLDVCERGEVELRARHGQSEAVVRLRERRDCLVVDDGVGGTDVTLHWNPRTFQWDGRRSLGDLPSEPAWYTLAKRVVTDLGSHRGHS